MRRRILVSVAAVALLLGACAMAVYFIQASENLLLRRSVKVADATGWNTNGEMFQVVESPGAKSPDIYFTKNFASRGNKVTTDLYLRKGFDGTETRLIAISRLVHSTGASIGNTLFSEDMNQLLWTSRNGHGHITQGHIANLDGSHHHYWSVKIPTSVQSNRTSDTTVVQWAHNHKIVEIRCTPEFTYPLVIWRDARTLKETGRVVLSKTSDINVIKPNVSYPVVDSKGILLTYAWKSQGTACFLDHYRFDLKANGKLLERHRVNFPIGAELQAMDQYPLADRVLWQFKSTYLSPIAVFIHRFIPGFSADAQTTLRFYESRSDGSAMHELGHIPYQAYDADTELKIAWVPNKKCVYFVYEDALYRLPVD